MKRTKKGVPPKRPRTPIAAPAAAELIELLAQGPGVDSEAAANGLASFYATLDLIGEPWRGEGPQPAGWNRDADRHSELNGHLHTHPEDTAARKEAEEIFQRHVQENLPRARRDLANRANQRGHR